MEYQQDPWSGQPLGPYPSEQPVPQTPQPVSPTPAENPVWSGWDVLQIAVLTVATIFILLLLIGIATQRILQPSVGLMEVLKQPLISVFAQLGAYVFILGFMVAVVKRVPGRKFWQEIKWLWPKSWSAYLMAGVIMSIALQALAHLLPMPKDLPIDRFFQTPQEAWILSIFGMTLAPLMEELFFRGFLYPVLVRRLGIALAILLTAAGFGLIHAPQLGRAWGPVLVVFLVGLTLTVTRAITKSVAPGFLMHVAYNGTISVFIFIGTDGFRHLDRLAQ